MAGNVERRLFRKQDGFITPVLLVVLIILIGPLITVAVISWEEVFVSRRWLMRNTAFHLAEYAFWEWLSRSAGGEEGFVPQAEPLYGAAEPWDSEDLTGRWEKGTYLARGTWQSDSDDEDDRLETPLILYNRAFGFSDSPFEEEGYPVLTVYSEGAVAGYRAALEVELTYQIYQPPEAAALISGGSLLLTGPILVDGRNHGADGEIDSSVEGLPALLCRETFEESGDVILQDGSSAAGSLDFDSTLQDPYAAISLNPSSRYLEKQHYSGTDGDPFEGTRFFEKDYSGPVSGQGTMIVHNPRFDPLKYEASYLASLGYFTEDYDPSYSHLDFDNQPAALAPRGDGTFTGLIIADGFSPGTGRMHIVGQMILLGRLRTTLGMSDGITILFSREALRENVHGDCDQILSWQRER